MSDATSDRPRPALRGLRTPLLDAGGLAAIAAVLVALHLLVPPALHDRLILHHGDPSLPTVWTSAFLHRDDAHLRSNLLGYAVAVAPTYLLYARWERRRAFWATVTLLLLVVPPATSLVDFWLFSARFDVAPGFNSQGFSGVASAFGGMLLASVGLFVADEYDRMAGAYAAELIAVLAVGLLALVSGILSPSLAGLIVLATALLGGRFVSLAWVRDPGRFVDALRENRSAFLVVAYGGLAVCWIIPAIFPVDVVHGGTLTNVFAHGVGFGVGIVVTLAQFTIREKSATLD